MSDATRASKRDARLRDVPLENMRINPVAQRELNMAWVDHLVSIFDPEAMQPPHVNQRDGSWFVMDGQHSIEALKAWLGHWRDQKVQCWTYVGLSIEQEAEMFLMLNNKKTVPVLPKFRAAVSAGHADQCDIDRIVRAQGLSVTRDRVPGGVRAVGTLERVYQRSGAPVLARSLRIIRDAYGDDGLDAKVIDGISMLCQRYNGELNDEHAIEKLNKAHAGVSGLLNKAARHRNDLGSTWPESVAIAAVEIINSGKGGPKKLPRWRGESVSA